MTVTMTMYGKIGANLLGGETAGESSFIDWDSDTMKVALATTTYTPNVDTHEFFSDVTNELTTALGYTAGGATLGSKTVTYTASGNITVFDAADTSWTASGGSLVFRYAIVYKDTGTASTSPLIGYLDLTTQTITDGNTATIVWDATNGVFKITATYMAINFPSSLDDGTSIPARVSTNAITAADQNLWQAALLAIEAKVGANSSAVSTSHDYKLTPANLITALTGVTGGLPIIGEVTADVLFTTSNTTLQNVTGLTFTIGASATEVWFVEIFLEMTAANATMDAKFGWASLPASATINWGVSIGNQGGAFGGYGFSAVATSPLALYTAASTPAAGLITGSVIDGFVFWAKVYGGGTGGAVQFMACQNTSDSGQLTAKAGSILRATKVKA